MKGIKFIGFILFVFAPAILFSQTDAGVKIMPKQGELYENAKNLNNPYVLPAWGKKLGAKGFLLPYPIGIMLNGYAGSQDVTISDLEVGINDGKMVSLDDIVSFSDVKATIRNFNMRADIWALPFLDVYGIFGKAYVDTKVSLAEPVVFSTQANFDGYVYGFGAMLTGGARSFFFSLDFNRVWTHFDELKGDNVATNLAPRVGYIFHFDNKPERNISLWTGAGRVFLSNTTEGTIKMSDILPDTPGEKIQTWYNGLTPAKQAIVSDIYQSIAEKHGNDEIHYSLNKRPAHNWCMILGAQYQLDRHWQFRVETNFLGGRQSGLISANYRFGIW